VTSLGKSDSKFLTPPPIMTKLKDLKETSVASTIGIVVHREEEEVDQNGMLAYAYHFQWDGS